MTPHQSRRYRTKLPGSPTSAQHAPSDIKKFSIFPPPLHHQSVISLCRSCYRKRLCYLCELLKLTANCCEPAGFRCELQSLVKILCSRWAPLTYHMAHQGSFTLVYTPVGLKMESRNNRIINSMII